MGVSLWLAKGQLPVQIRTKCRFIWAEISPLRTRPPLSRENVMVERTSPACVVCALRS